MFDNPVYNLLELHKPELAAQFKIEKLAAHAGQVSFFKVTTRQTARTSQISLIIDKETYLINESHVTIFSNFLTLDKADERKASFHLTIHVTQVKTQEKFVIRVYYSKLADVISVVLKNAKQQIVAINKLNYLKQFVQLHLQDFINTLYNIYYIQRDNNALKAKIIFEQIQQLSETVFTKSPSLAAINTYQKLVDEVTTLYLECSHFEFMNYAGKIRFCQHLKSLVTTKMESQDAPTSTPDDIPLTAETESIESSPTSQPMHKDDLKKRNVNCIAKIDSQLAALNTETKLPHWRKTIKRYQLLNDKFHFLLSDDEEAIFSCLEELNKITANAPRQLLESMLPDKGYPEDPEALEDFNHLIEIQPVILPRHILIAIKNNRIHAMQTMLQHDKSFNLNAKVMDLYLLEHAYQSENVQAFKILIEHGASVNIMDTLGKSLLLRVCHDQKVFAEYYILSLLHAGAMDTMTYPPMPSVLGYLLICGKESPQFNVVSSLLFEYQALNINMRLSYNGKSYTLLSYACTQPSLEELAIMLVNFNASPFEFTEPDHLSPVDLAALNGHSKFLEHLMKVSTGPLHTLCQKTLNEFKDKLSPAIIALLSDYLHKHTPEQVTAQTPEVYLAAQWNDTARLHQLLKYKANPNAQTALGWTPLMVSICQRHEASFNILIDHSGIDPNIRGPQGYFALFYAVKFNLLKMVLRLIQHKRTDVNLRSTDNSTALWVAAYEGFLDIVKVLLKHADIDPNPVDNLGITPVGTAIALGHFSVAFELINHRRINLDLPHDDASLLHLAIFTNHLPIIVLLINRLPHFLNSTLCKLGTTPLGCAANYNLLEVAQALMSHPATNVNHKNKDGSTALHICVINNHQAVAKALLKHKDIDCNQTNSLGQSALFIAVRKQSHDMIHILLTHPHIDIDQPALVAGLLMTPLMAAIANEDKVTVDLLLNHPKMNKENKTSLAWARQLELPEMVDMLRLFYERKKDTSSIKPGLFKQMQANNAANSAGDASASFSKPRLTSGGKNS